MLAVSTQDCGSCRSGSNPEIGAIIGKYMFIDYIEIDGKKVEVRVEINDLKTDYHKCARCSKYLPEVDRDILFAMTCDRCSTVLHEFLYDIHYGYNLQKMPADLKPMNSEIFIKLFVRPNLSHMSFEELQKL